MKVKAPCRISFAGGGTDISPYCEEYGGAVLSAAIKRYATAEFPVNNPTPADLERVIPEHFGLNDGLRVKADWPPMCGLGGSASCFVAGIRAVRPGLESKMVAELAVDLERRKLGVKGGRQDQYASVYGGLNYMTFNSGVTVERLSIPRGLASLLFLVYLGRRVINGHDIIVDQMSRDNKENFAFQKHLAWGMKLALAKNDLTSFGLLMNMAWYSKLRFSPLVGTPEIKAFHGACMRNGAIAGKLTGAGGGGYMLLMEHPDKKGKLRQHLIDKGIAFEPVEFDTEGARCL